MPQPPIRSHFRLGQIADPGSVSYALGGRVFHAPQAIPALAAFVTHEASAPPAPPDVATIQSPDWKHQVRGYVAGRDRQLMVHADARGLQLNIERIGAFQVSYSGEICADEPMPESLWAEVVCGPLLPLALALQGCFQLHASACLTGRGATLIAGSSGHGKSTLCNQLVRRGHAPLADDAIAVAASPAHCTGPGPQPKWPQWHKPWPETSPAVGALVLLQPQTGATPALHQVSVTAATLALARHTVAASLFPPMLLARHLNWCADLAQQVPVWALTYDRKPAQIGAMLDLLEKRCAS